MEKEVMAECGAWKNFLDLEDSLTLEELLELFEIAQDRQNRLIRAIAMSLGATFDEEDDSQPRGSLTSDGKYIPGAVNSEEDAMAANMAVGSNIVAFYSRLDD